MALPGSFKKKLANVLNDAESTLGRPDRPSNDYFQEFVDYLVDRISIGALASYIPQGDFCEIEPGRVIGLLLNSEKYGHEFLELAGLNNTRDKVYNLYVNAYDVDHSAAKIKTHPSPSQFSDEYLKGILASEYNQLSALRKPAWNCLSGRCFDNLVDVVGDPMVALSKMTMLEIQACYSTLPKYGVRIFEDDDVRDLRFYPYVFVEEFTKNQLYPTFNLMKSLHGAIKAQNMMDEVAKRIYPVHTFLSTHDLNVICKDDPCAFISTALKERSPIHERAMAWLIGALRNEGLISMLDDLPAANLKKLVSTGCLVMEDIDTMPKAMKIFKRQKLESDLAL